MILAVALATQLVGPRILEVPEPESRRILVQVHVAAPRELGPREAAAWQVLGHSLLAGGKSLTGDQIREYGTQAGLPPRVDVLPDLIQIQFAVPEGALDLAGLLVEEVLSAPRLPESTVAAVLRDLSNARPSAWRVALAPQALSPNTVRRSDIVRLAEEALRPDRLVIVVGGAIQPGEASAEFGPRFPGVAPNRFAAPPIALDLPASPRSRGRGEVRVSALSGPPLTPATGGSPARVLALIALGTGKDSAMFRVLREREGWTYLQEGMLWPTREGWRPRLVWACLPEQGAPTIAQVRQALLDDVATWDEATLARARAMAEASLTWANPFSPFWLTGEGPRGATLEDRLRWRGYLETIGSGAIAESLWLSSMQEVALEDLQTAAQALLTEAEGHVVEGGG